MTQLIGELFGRYAKNGYVSEDGFILAVISLLGSPPAQSVLTDIGFHQGKSLTYREFVTTMTNLTSRAHEIDPSLTELKESLKSVFTNNSLTLVEFIAAIKHQATLLDVSITSDEQLVGLYQYAGGTDTITMDKFATFIHKHTGTDISV